MTRSDVAHSATTHTVRRLSVELGQRYDDAVRRFEEIIPVIDTARFRALTNWDDVVALADEVAPLGFMRFWKADVPTFMTGSTATWDCVEYLMGNHVIAERMYRHDSAVMLHAPLRVLIRADEDGQAIFVIDQPSTLFDSYLDPAISEVGRDLDEKVAGVLTALGATPPAELAAS
jgi:hypothetical protein